ncbi:putative F-box associated interaction domain-containing protein [Helianthus annuus]|nr:putative F-box associated interaction domain-containing protein [Helianthus annuus]KAJ0759665.1 putative F-box associated interaction domain-containing protein [Helianthus annuus]
MHKIFKLPDPYTDVKDFTRIRYLFGFDESRNEHKILMIRDSSLRSMEIIIFSMSSYSWRKIHAEPPLGFTWDGLWLNFYHNVCVNSVIHIMLAVSFDILAFDLGTKKFSIITTPQGVLPEDYDDTKQNDPYIIKLNGCIGVVCYDSVAENNEMYIWILQDYKTVFGSKKPFHSPMSGLRYYTLCLSLWILLIWTRLSLSRATFLVM